MPADYEKIREENIARYGWDTAVLDLLGHLYSERTHFIFELIQNAEDAGATGIAFDVHDDRLEVRHDGRPFTEADVRGVCGVAKSTKDLTSIGKFGIGFKAVYAYTRIPRVYSGDEAFRIENYVRPYAVDPVGTELLKPGGTLFVFPLDSAADAEEIRAAVRALDPDALLFLRNLQHSHNKHWRVFRRPVGAHHVEIAFRAEPAIVPCASSPLYVYLPTQKETFLGFLVQGPYRTTPARDNVGEHDPDNQALVRETAILLRDALRELRDDGLLTVHALAALPVDPVRFPPGSFFRPLYDAARDALTQEDLIPAADGGYRKAADIRLAADPELHDLFGAGNPYVFVPDGSTPALYAYLRDEAGIAEVTAVDPTAEFLQARSDEWLIGFYRYILRDLDRWRSRPVIRLEDGSHVVPSAAYLPGPGPSGFPTVRRAIAANPSARALLDAFGLATPDVVDEVLELVLPKYAEELPDDHDADLALIMRALDEAPAARRQLLGEWLEDTAFLQGERADSTAGADGEQRLCRPGELYQRSRELEVYFGGNPDVWFAADRYGPWRLQLREMGVRESVAVLARKPDLFGHVVLADEFARHERGVDGFDPDAEIDGLEFALRHPSHARSEYVWNAVLAPNHRLIAGLVEKSVREAFADSTREISGSAISEAARREAWLPAPDGSFRRPAELSVEDLPSRFTQDENLARALGMAEPVVARAARQLGLPAELLWTLSARPDLVAHIMGLLNPPVR
ncbi:MAG TPA: hypothetical protein VGG16_23905 [Streptosporangiaceae bacterium]